MAKYFGYCLQENKNKQQEKNMKKNKKTRVYHYHDHPYRVRKVWPKRGYVSDGVWIEGEKAEVVYRGADYICVSIRVHKGQDYWSVQPGPVQTGESFEVDFKGESDKEHYAQLTKELENRSCKKGLTILVS